MNNDSDFVPGLDGPQVGEPPLTPLELTLAWAGPCAGMVGQELDYTLEVTNSSESDIGVLTSVSLPTGLAFVAAEGATHDPPAGQVSWEPLVLAAGEGCRLSLRLRAEAPIPTRLHAEARSAEGFSVQADWPVVIEPERTGSSRLGQLLAEAEKDLKSSTAAPRSEPRSLRALSTDEEGERHLLISMTGKEYALPASGVVEVSQPLPVAPVPNVPGWLLGLTNVRGEVVSVVDLRAFLGLGTGENTAQTRMVVVRSLAGDLTTIFLVDGVRSIRRLLLGDGQSHAITDPRLAGFVRGMREYNNSLLIVLDLEHLLESAELRELEQA